MAATAALDDQATTMTTPLLEAKHAARSFDGPPPVHALRDFSLRVNPGERVALMGPSGAGKSTALNLLGLLDRPTSGDVFVNGESTAAWDDETLSEARGRTLGFVFQSFHLVPYRTVEQNVAMGLLYHASPRDITAERIASALEAVGLMHRRTARARTLSGGEAQRVALARAIVHRPRVLLADEPTGNLDSARSQEIQDLLATLIDEHTAQIIVTHDPAVAARLDRIVHVVDGCSTTEARAAEPEMREEQR